MFLVKKDFFLENCGENHDFWGIFDPSSSRRHYQHFEFQKIVKQKWFVISIRNFSALRVK
jgi:hypothetical protein